VLINLLSNAIKFSKKCDKVKIMVKIENYELVGNKVGTGDIIV
jgi:K+-sensing histidine kinase KdpD